MDNVTKKLTPQQAIEALERVCLAGSRRAGL